MLLSDQVPSAAFTDRVILVLPSKSVHYMSKWSMTHRGSLKVKSLRFVYTENGFPSIFSVWCVLSPDGGVRVANEQSIISSVNSWLYSLIHDD